MPATEKCIESIAYTIACHKEALRILKSNQCPRPSVLLIEREIARQEYELSQIKDTS